MTLRSYSTINVIFHGYVALENGRSKFHDWGTPYTLHYVTPIQYSHRSLLASVQDQSPQINSTRMFYSFFAFISLCFCQLRIAVNQLILKFLKFVKKITRGS